MSRKTSLILTLAVMFAVGCDADGDGVADADDCAPGDADINPDADEVCDGVDNNCDGNVDEGVTLVFYADADGDNFGGTLTIEACEAPAGFLEDNTDCDDLNADSNPDAQEVCDDVDNDCDGLVDADDDSVDASTGSTFYADSDTDNYGDPDSSVESCSTPTGYVDNAEDCDDSNSAINPETVWYADIDGDEYGSDSFTKTGCEQPDNYSIDGGDCDENDAAINPGATETCDGVDQNCDSDIPADETDDDSDGYVDCEDWVGSDEAIVGDNDCNDDNAAVNPGASEVCDGEDNDCDGNTDFALSVPTDYATIQEAIDASTDGDGVCVDAGTYTENLYFDGKSLTIGGAGIGSSIIDAGGWQFTYLYDAESVTITGFTIQNSYYDYGGVAELYDGAELTLSDVAVTDSGCDGYYCDGGLFYVTNATLNLDGVDIDGAYVYGNYVYGGIVEAYLATVNISDSSVTNSTIDAGYDSGSSGYLYGGLLYSYDSTVSLSGFEFSGNAVSSNYNVSGGFVYASSYTELTADDVQFNNNSVNADSTSYSTFADAGYYFWYQSGSDSNSTITNSTIQGNDVYAGDDAWAAFYLASSGGSFTMENALVTDNYIEGGINASGGYAYGLTYVYYTDVSFTNVDLASNHWEGFDILYASLGYRSYNGDLTLTNTNVVNNTENVGQTYAGLLYTSYANDEGYGEFTMNYSNDYGNWTDWAYGANWYDYGSEGDTSSFAGNIAADPLYTDASTWDYTLASGSPAIDAGDPSLLDTDGSTSDIGAYGGPNADL